MATVYLASIGTGAARGWSPSSCCAPVCPITTTGHGSRTRPSWSCACTIRTSSRCARRATCTSSCSSSWLWSRAAISPTFGTAAPPSARRSRCRSRCTSSARSCAVCTTRTPSPASASSTATSRPATSSSTGAAWSASPTSASPPRRLKGSLTVPGVVFGKVGYMSPEQARHETLDGRADVYACGAVLWELLTGRPLRGGDGVDTEDVSNFNAPPASSYSSRVDSELDTIVAKALARDREDRYLSAHDFMEALGAWLARRGVVGNAGTEQVAEFLAMLFGDASVARARGPRRPARRASATRPRPRPRTAARRPTRTPSATPSPRRGVRPLALRGRRGRRRPRQHEDHPAARATRSPRAQRRRAQAPSSQPRRPRPKDEFGFPRTRKTTSSTSRPARSSPTATASSAASAAAAWAPCTSASTPPSVAASPSRCSRTSGARSELVAKRFRAEARAASAAGHPNIIEVFDAGQLPDGRLYLVMEYLTGRNLYDEMEELGTLPIGRACRIIRAVARAIRAAHDVGIIHRDLKPDNVMFVPLPEGEGETVKVLDFGISAGAERTEAEARLTVPGHALGTPEYMAPEQAKGKDATELFDVYALGVMLYECLVGEPPFVSNNLVEIMARKSTEKAPSLGERRRDVPKALVTLVDACLEINPADRPQSAREFLQRLEECHPHPAADGEPGDGSDVSLVGVPVARLARRLRALQEAPPAPRSARSRCRRRSAGHRPVRPIGSACSASPASPSPRSRCCTSPSPAAPTRTRTSWPPTPRKGRPQRQRRHQGPEPADPEPIKKVAAERPDEDRPDEDRPTKVDPTKVDRRRSTRRRSTPARTPARATRSCDRKLDPNERAVQEDPRQGQHGPQRPQLPRHAALPQRQGLLAVEERARQAEDPRVQGARQVQASAPLRAVATPTPRSSSGSACARSGPSRAEASRAALCTRVWSTSRRAR
jgi:serine/threonine protein kinase